MVVTFILLNKTKPVRGDVEVIVYPEKGLMDALNALKNSVQSGQFKVEFQQGKDCNNKYDYDDVSTGLDTTATVLDFD